MPPERVERLWRWHEEASEELHALGAHEVEYLGLQLHVPAQVFPPTPTSDLLGRAVLARTRPKQRVLDMGCGAGANAILAAQHTDDVLGVDVNPTAVSAARANAERNGVAERTWFAESDVFDAVDGEFDLIVFDPPFRWFQPRDLLERAFADENYATLTRFMREVSDRLRPGGEHWCSSVQAETLRTWMNSSRRLACRARRSPSARLMSAGRQRPTSSAA